MNRLKPVLMLLLCVSILSCNRNKKEEPLPINDFVYEAMKRFYFWDDKLPANVRPGSFSNPEDLLEALRYRPLDRWSFIVQDNGAALEAAVSGANRGYGYGWGFDTQQQLRFVFIQPGTPAADAGLRRGFRVLKVNGQTVTSSVPQHDPRGTITLEIQESGGAIREVQLTAREFNSRGVLHHQIYDVGSKKVGYIVYNTFTQTSIQEIDPVFAEFKREGVNEVVLDMRYNGGGLVSTARHLASLLAPAAADGKLFLKYQYNSRNTDLNESANFTNPANRLELTRLYVIQTGNTASASELVVNALRPFMNVELIGSRSYGKFVGSRYFVNQGYTFSPIMFSSVNANGDSFPEGFQPTFQTPDDRRREFGNPEEWMLGAALYHIANGSYQGFVGSGRSEALPDQPVYSNGKELEPIPVTDPRPLSFR
jgi:C-terminal processing protease CtpA/Prc